MSHSCPAVSAMGSVCRPSSHIQASLSACSEFPTCYKHSPFEISVVKLHVGFCESVTSKRVGKIGNSGVFITRRRLGAARAAFERKEEEPKREEVNGRVALNKLDDQLRALSSSSTATSSSQTSREASDEPGKNGSSTESADHNLKVATLLKSWLSMRDDTQEEPRKEDRLEWPIFSDGFLAYAGAGLLLITVLNNIVFRMFLGPPVNPDKNSPPAPRERFRLQSRNEVTTLDAPPLADRQ